MYSSMFAMAIAAASQSCKLGVFLYNVGPALISQANRYAVFRECRQVHSLLSGLRGCARLYSDLPIFPLGACRGASSYRRTENADSYGPALRAGGDPAARARAGPGCIRA